VLNSSHSEILRSLQKTLPEFIRGSFAAFSPDFMVALLFRATNSSWAVSKEAARAIRRLVKDCNSTSKPVTLSLLERPKKG
jgi:hypothetical protein